MRRTAFALTLIAATGLAACMTDRDAAAGSTVLASGILANAQQASVGTVNIVQGASGPEISVSVSTMRPGTYGIHLHTVGRCDPPTFTTAGEHWNPTMREHGRLNPRGTHHGDLPNLVVGPDGSGMLKAPFVGSLTGTDGLFDADGAAMVIHAQRDDERTNPSGNSGDRIACATLSRS